MAARLRDGDPSAAEVLAALRKAMFTMSGPDTTPNTLAQAYAAVAARLREGDPHIAEELAELREEMAKTANPNDLSALTLAYGAVAARLGEGDPQAAEELAALREAMVNATGSDQLSSFAQAYAALAKGGDVPGAVQPRDFALLLQGLQLLEARISARPLLQRLRKQVIRAARLSHGIKSGYSTQLPC